MPKHLFKTIHPSHAFHRCLNAPCPLVEGIPAPRGNSIRCCHTMYECIQSGLLTVQDLCTVPNSAPKAYVSVSEQAAVC